MRTTIKVAHTEAKMSSGKKKILHNNEENDEELKGQRTSTHKATAGRKDPGGVYSFLSVSISTAKSAKACELVQKARQSRRPTSVGMLSPS